MGRTEKEEGEVKRKRKREEFSVEEINKESRKGSRSKINLQGRSRRENNTCFQIGRECSPYQKVVRMINLSELDFYF